MIPKFGDNDSETIEILYGMVWYLASITSISFEETKELIDKAQDNYDKGLVLSQSE